MELIPLAAEPVSLTVTIVIAVIATVIGIIATILVSWWFSKSPPPLPICKVSTLTSSESSGTDMKGWYTCEDVKWSVMLSSIKSAANLDSFPREVHLRS